MKEENNIIIRKQYTYTITITVTDHIKVMMMNFFAHNQTVRPHGN